MGRKTNIYDVEEHKVTKVKLNPWVLSTLKNSKYIWRMKAGATFDKSIVEPLVILSYLVNRQVW